MNPKSPEDPFDEFMFLSGDLEELFEAHKPFGRPETGFLAGRSMKPAADVFESPEGLEIHLEVPGVSMDDLDISVEGERLVVSGHREFVKDFPNEEYLRLERGFGSFRRVFEIPSGVEASDLEACLEQGILTIKVKCRPLPIHSINSREGFE